MFKKILVPTDGSALSEIASNAAVEFARAGGSEIVVLAVAEPYVYSALAEGAVLFPTDSALFEERVKTLAQEHVDKVARLAADRAVPCTTLVSLSLSPGEEIAQTAEQHHCDVIFIASHGRRGLNRLLLGSETQKVLEYATVPVLVFR